MQITNSCFEVGESEHVVADFEASTLKFDDKRFIYSCISSSKVVCVKSLVSHVFFLRLESSSFCHLCLCLASLCSLAFGVDLLSVVCSRACSNTYWQECQRFLPREYF